MFQKKIVDYYLSFLDKNVLKEKYELFSKTFLDKAKQENIRHSKEEQYQEGFLRDLFCQILGYVIKPEKDFNLFTEAKNDVKNKSNSKKADGAICEKNNENNVKCVIELKSTQTKDLDNVAFQAFSYKNFHSNCRYIIVSNFERLRFYIDVQSDFIEFNLFNLDFDNFSVLYLLLEANQLNNDIPTKIKNESLSAEKQITDDFYKVYSSFKRSLFEDLKENNPEIDKLLLFKKTQKLLDRILFIRFCSDRGLLPANSILNILKRWKTSKENFIDVSLYSLFKQFFNWIDKGFDNPNDKNKSIFAYNGGLFKPDDILDNIKIGDDVLYTNCDKMGQYDFESQISVDILGRVFENSLTEIEEIEKEIEEEKNGLKVSNDNKGKRKKDGVFYTPEYITNYIVENTIGVLCNDKRKELEINSDVYNSDRKYSKKQVLDLEARLTDYRNWLFSLKILDLACGSGAFLNSALKQLRKEHNLIDTYFNSIHKETSLNFETIENDNSILENNLYGVDINEDSIEITKLSLWLNTAKKNRKLTTLNNKIKCGNSLIDSPDFEKAFDWKKEFKEVFENGGFDVIISNPPYVRIQTLNKEDVNFYNKEYSNITIGNYDLYILFLYKGFNLLKENGKLGFILPNKFFTSENGLKIRDYLYRNECVNEIDDFTTNQLFVGATTYTTLLFLSKSEQKTFNYRKIELGQDFKNFMNKEKNVFETSLLASETWTFSNKNVNVLINKIKNCEYSLEKITTKIFKGSSTGNDKIFLLKLIKENEKTLIVKSDVEDTTFEIEKEIVKPFIYGEDVKRYLQPVINKYVIFPYKLDDNKNRVLMTLNDIKTLYPFCFNYLERHKTELLKRKLPLNEENYFKYSAGRNLNEYENKKILIPDMLVKNRITYDKTGLIYHGAMIHSIIFNNDFDKIDYRIFLAILNSSLFWFFIKNTSTAISGNAYRLTPEYLNPFGIPNLTENKYDSIKNDLCLYADKMLSLNKDLQEKINRFRGRVKEEYNLNKITQSIEDFYKLPFADFVKELSKQKVKLTLKQKDDLQDYFNGYVKDISALNEEIEKTDKEINRIVYKLYDLTDEEIQTIEAEK